MPTMKHGDSRRDKMVEKIRLKDRPRCAYCGKRVLDFKGLKHSVTWEAGDLKGKYMHKKCLYDSGEFERELYMAFKPMCDALELLKKRNK